jgi:hypothetical protein
VSSGDYQKEIIEHRGKWNCSCPKCGAYGNWNRHGSYKRYLSIIEDNRIDTRQMDILRLKCMSCGTTHAVLAYDIIPYRVFSLSLFWEIMLKLYGYNQSIWTLCNSIEVSYQTLRYMVRALINLIRNVYSLLWRMWLWDGEKILDMAEIIAILSRIPQSELQQRYLEEYAKPLFLGRESSGAYTLYYGMLA